MGQAASNFVVIVTLWAVVGAMVGVLIDRFATRWQPPVLVPAAMGATTALTPPAPWLNLPIVGWLLPALTRGPSTLTFMRATVELIGGAAFAGLITLDLSPLHLLTRAALVVVFLTILRIDWQYHLIQDQTILFGLMLAAVAAVAVSPLSLLGSLLAGIGAAAVFLFFYLLARVLYGRAALGFGDVLLAGLIGAAVGPAAVLGTLFLGMVLASLGGVIVSVMRRGSLRAYFAYGAYLAIAAIAALAFPAALGRLPGFL